MTLRQYLTIMSAGASALWAAVAVIVTQIDPTDAPTAVVVIFYLSLFAALTGTLAVVGFISRILVLRKTFLLSRQVIVSFRQSAIISALAVVALVLRSRSVLNWWDGALLVLGATALETFFISAASRNTTRPHQL